MPFWALMENLVSRFGWPAKPKRLIPVLQFDLPGFKAKAMPALGSRIAS